MTVRSLRLVAAIIMTVTTCPIPTAHAQAWLAAADPFEKLVNGILDFTKYLIDRHDRHEHDAISQSPAALVKSMQALAAEKRHFALMIESFVERQGRGNINSSSLANETSTLKTDVQNMVDTIKTLDPVWISRHPELNASVNSIETEKIDTVNSALAYFNNGRGNAIARNDILQFANRLKSLADKLDQAAVRVAVAFNT